MRTVEPRKAAPAAPGPRLAPPARTNPAPPTTPGVRAGAPPALRFGNMYLTGEGRWVELPPDITYEQAVRLEAEAKAAEKRLGKGPAPKPVPDVKKLAKKEERKEKPKPPTKVGRAGKGARKAALKAAGAAAATLKTVGVGKVAQYLAGKATPVLVKGFGKLQKLRQNEQTHDDAAEKLNQTEKAVVIPPSEGQSKSNTVQVNTVGGRAAPTVDENKGKQKLQEKLAENIPRTIEDVDNFKRDKKAQHTGAEVMKVVLSDKNAVVSTFQDIGQTPPPAPREHEPENLPPPEPTPRTAGMNLGQDAIAPLQKEHTDLSNFTKEADGKLKEEGITQEQLDMVDSGDLAKANQEKKGMEKAATTQPAVMQKFALQEAAKVDRELKQEESRERQALMARRKAGLGATGQRQKGAKSQLEKKREEVAAKINAIYSAAQEKVKKKLADLETASMKRFDNGNAKATREFEDSVNRELAAFKADRYSGWFGWARKARDWLLGIDDLPQVKAIFERNRSAFVATINKLVEDISADNKRAVQECKDQLLKARTEIKEFVGKLGPALRDIGRKAAEDMNSKLNALDQFIAQREEELQNKLKDKQTAAIKAIDEKIEKMKEAMSGALAKLGKLLLWAAKKFFTWALEKFGFSLSDIESIINKGVAVLKAIFTGPIKFVKNLIKAASTGFKSFGKNFITHLKNAVFEWLTGSLEGLKLPETWDLKGVLSVIFQMAGITYDNIRKHLTKYIPEPVIKTLETTFALLKTLIKKGPMAAWEQLKQIGADLQEAFINAVKDWIKWKIVQKAIETVLSMFIPGAGIIRAIIAIYDTIVFFIQKAKEIMRMIGNFLGSIAEIAAGNIGAAATALEEGLARGLKLVIEFLARFLRLSGITQKIREVIQKLRTKVDDVLDKVAKWIASKAKHLIGKGVAAVKAGAAAVVQWWRVRKGFTGADGKSHTISVDRRDNRPVITVRSTEQTLQQIIAVQPESKRKQLQDKYSRINSLVGGSEPDAKEHEKRHAQVRQTIDEVALLLGPGDVRPTVVTHAIKSGGRAHRVIADPLTIRAGNTAGSPSKGIQFKDLISALVEPREQEQHRQTTTTREVFSMFRSAHLLSEKLHGPAESWNLADTGTGINTRMSTGPEKTADDLKKRGAELRYVTTVAYHNEADPETDRAKLAAGSAEQKLKWLGSLVAKTFHVSISVLKPPTDGKVDSKVGDFGPFDDGSGFLSNLKLVGGPAPPTIAELVYKKAVETAGADGRVIPRDDLARHARIDANDVTEALRELSKPGGKIEKRGRFYYVKK